MGSRRAFFKELHAHKPHLRRLPDRPNNDTRTAVSNHTARTPPTRPPPPPVGPAKYPRMYITVAVKSFNIPSTSMLRQMPISISDGLPHASFSIGTETSQVADLVALVDSGAMLSTGYKPFHEWVRTNYPSCVLKYEEFNGDNPFSPVKLEGAITDPTAYDAAVHGLLTAVITYRTGLRDQNSGKQISMPFALGDDLTANTIIGLPSLSAIGGAIDLFNGKLVCHLAATSLPLEMMQPRRGLPEIAKQPSPIIAASQRQVDNRPAWQTSKSSLPVASPQPIKEATSVTKQSKPTVTFQLPPLPPAVQPTAPGTPKALHQLAQSLALQAAAPLPVADFCPVNTSAKTT